MSKISAGIKDGVHSIHVTYVKEVGGEADLVKASIAGAREKARNYEFEGMEDLFDDQVKFISKQIIEEDVFLAVWTNTSFLRPRQIAQEKSEIAEAKKELPIADDAHGLVDTYSHMKVKHENYVEAVIDGLAASGVQADVVDRDQAMLSMAQVIYPFLGAGFQFIFPDRETYPKAKAHAGGLEDDASHLLWDSVSSQIIREDDIDVDLTEGVVRVGDRYFSTFEVKNPPRNLVLFNAIGDVIKSDVPCMFSFAISSASSFTFFWKKLLSTLPVPASNKRIKKSIQAVSLLKEVGEPDVEYKVSVTTWSQDSETLFENRDYLKGEVSSWGNSVVRNYRGCPFDALASSIQGMNYKTFGSTVYAPLSGVLAQLPFGRRLRFWRRSALNFVGNGDVIYPYAVQSSEQKFWNIGVCATMGSGKSVLLQNIAFSHLFGETIGGEMPMVGYIDNGFSAKTMVETLAAMAPKNKKHLFKHITYENNKKFAYNIFDTQIGCRYADSDQMNQIISTLVGIITPAGEEKVHGDAANLLRKVVKEAYFTLSDKEKPRYYREGRAPKLDASLKKIGYDATGKTYWEIVDDLFDQKRLVMAEFAQRFAVPSIQDVIQQLTISDTVNNSYKGIVAYNNEELVPYVRRALMEAIEKYPVFSGVTVLDVNMARFIVLDLDRVAKSGNAEMDKDSSVFYALARFIVSNNMFISSTLMEVVPEKYKVYHHKRIDLVKSIPKLLVYDEYHRLKSPTVISQIKREMREGRKWSLINVFASQLLQDFDESMQNLLSTTFLMSNDAGSKEEIKSTFALNEDTMNYVMSELTGPKGARGASIVGLFKFKKATLIQRLRFVLYPYMYWMTTSDAIDNSLKQKVMAKLPVSEAIQALSSSYGFGSRKVYENISETHPDPEVKRDPIQFMADSLVSGYLSMKS
ncbi:ATP-binding protein [Photobacterium galatheae]|nr:ATP-binding protein [Photobacterium galatheae]MCM0149217.1 ATP-binding protein [Photobacterium galatheae]